MRDKTQQAIRSRYGQSTPKLKRANRRDGLSAVLTVPNLAFGLASGSSYWTGDRSTHEANLTASPVAALYDPHRYTGCEQAAKMTVHAMERVRRTKAWSIRAVAASVLWGLLLLSAAAQGTPPILASNPPKNTDPTADAVSPQDTAVTEVEAKDPEEEKYGVPRHSDREERLSYFILGFGSLVLIVQFLLLRTPRRSTHEILQLLTINLIVTGTLFLISAGFAAEQIAPGLGLFGTIAGYVLGRRATNDSGKDDSNGGMS